ncbi:MAG TPA: hypothetical protein VMF12_08755, partial [Xanthobacteraceae bacterium]|nr:hypothetical protein [Xanthobacteraceae bacterium]
MTAITTSAGPMPVEAPGEHTMRSTRRVFSALGWGFTGFSLILLSALMLWILVVVFMRGFGAQSIS